MKTLQDLVDSLNANVNNIGKFYVSKDLEDDFYLFCERNRDKSRIICFDTESGEAYRESGFSILNWEAINLISEYVINHTPDNWFTEKKYNIIIAKDIDSLFNRLCVYKKDSKGFIFTKDNATKIDLSFNDYQFTESEIEELKSTLPTNMAKIVELGKVEVKDD